MINKDTSKIKEVYRLDKRKQKNEIQNQREHKKRIMEFIEIKENHRKQKRIT